VSADLVRARDLDEALALLAERRDIVPLAGGTDVMTTVRRDDNRTFLDLSRIDALRTFGIGSEGLEIGALVTYRDLLDEPAVCEDWPCLAEAARATGAPTIQNRGTLGGNLANASPAADTPPALLAYDARVVLASVAGRRELPIDAFFVAYRKTALRPGELLVSIRVPHRDRGIHLFRKVAGRRAQAIAKVTVALWALTDGSEIVELATGFAAMGPIPLRARHLEADILGRPLADLTSYDPAPALARDLAPIDDLRSTARYRARVAANIVRRFLEQLD
jgi:CO/xanthine dehydrogenase FAD-binding subunit